jgi:nitrogen fixation protein FixH
MDIAPQAIVAPGTGLVPDGTKPAEFRWYLIPIIALTICLIPNVTLIVLAKQAHLAHSDDRPYLASQRVDHDKAQRQALATAGGAFTWVLEKANVRLSYQGPMVERVTVELQRPDDASGDLLVPWNDLGSPLTLTPGRSGAWKIRVRGDRGEGESLLLDASVEMKVR